MPFVVSTEVCSQCSLSTEDIVGVHIGVLRCTVCHCFISTKAMVRGKCPRFDNVGQMLAFKAQRNEQPKAG